jgi:hypothetical protein
MRDNIYLNRLTPEMNVNEVHDIIYGTKGYKARSGYVEHA